MSRNTVKRALLLLSMMLFLLLAEGCGEPAAGGPIDVPALQDELATVILQEKHAEGLDYDVTVACVSAASDGLRFSCHVDAANTGKPTQQWTETVSCLPPGREGGQRCSTDSGYSLQ